MYQQTQHFKVQKRPFYCFNHFVRHNLDIHPCHPELVSGSQCLTLPIPTCLRQAE